MTCNSQYTIPETNRATCGESNDLLEWNPDSHVQNYKICNSYPIFWLTRSSISHRKLLTWNFLQHAPQSPKVAPEVLSALHYFTTSSFFKSSHYLLQTHIFKNSGFGCDVSACCFSNLFSSHPFFLTRILASFAKLQSFFFFASILHLGYKHFSFFP